MIDWLKREVERKDTILMTLAQRVPELVAAPEPRESSQTPSEQQSSGYGLIRKTEARRSPPGGAASSGSNSTAS